MTYIIGKTRKKSKQSILKNSSTRGILMPEGVIYVHRLLIADSDDGFLMAASEAFSADFEVLTCQDGETALLLLSTFKPQALIINLMLPFKDGLTVLQEAAVLPPVIIATTGIILPYIENACAALNIGYLMVSPCLNALRVQLISMVTQWESDDTPQNLNVQAIKHLHIMNFPTHRIGYRQLCDAIPLYYQDRDQCLDTVLYAEIARTHGGNVKSVEKAMREVIKQAWEKHDPIVWGKYFQNLDTCPSNKVFFDAIADHLYG